MLPVDGLTAPVGQQPVDSVDVVALGCGRQGQAHLALTPARPALSGDRLDHRLQSLALLHGQVPVGMGLVQRLLPVAPGRGVRGAGAAHCRRPERAATVHCGRALRHPVAAAGRGPRASPDDRGLSGAAQNVRARAPKPLDNRAEKPQALPWQSSSRISHHGRPPTPYHPLKPRKAVEFCWKSGRDIRGNQPGFRAVFRRKLQVGAHCEACAALSSRVFMNSSGAAEAPRKGNSWEPLKSSWPLR